MAGGVQMYSSIPAQILTNKKLTPRWKRYQFSTLDDEEGVEVVGKGWRLIW